MYCKHCGKEIDDNSTFCKHCGKPLNGDATNFNIEPIKRFLLSNMKAGKVIFAILLCVLIGYFWYSKTPSNQMVGEWVWEARHETITEKFNSDGTFEYHSESAFGDYRVSGNWEMNGKTFKTTFWSRDEQKNLSDTYEIITLNSDELVFKHINESRERHFKRKK